MLLVDVDEERFEAQKIEKRILFRSTLSMLIIGILLASIVGIPLYQELKQKNRNELEYLAKSKKLVLDSYFSNINDIANQIASRTKVRQKLIEYNKGEISLEEAASFSKSLLFDAISISSDAVGMSRFAKDGRRVASVGKTPLEIDISRYEQKRTMLFLKNSTSIVIISPIIDKEYGFCGTDVIFFDKEPLNKIVKEYSGFGKSGELILLTKTNGEFETLFEERYGQNGFRLEQDIYNELKTKEMLFFEQTISNQNYINVIFALDTQSVVPIIRIKSDELFEIIDSNMVRIIAIAIAGLIFGVMAVFLLTHPLLKQISTELARRKEAELKLQKINSELNEMVKIEMQKQRDQEQMLVQQSKLASIGEMLGNVAHQWRQPLNALATHIQNAEDAFEYNEIDKEYMDKFVKKGMLYIKKMSTTIDDFRNFFAPDKEKQSFLLSKYIEDAIHIIEASLANNNIKITFNLIEDSEINGYPNEYSHTVLNILNNAKDALKSKTMSDKKIELELSKTDSGKSLLSIKDNGGGIDEHIMPKIFEPYFTTKHKSEGTGVGLYMVKIMIEKHLNGKVWAENSDGGAIFYIEV